MQQTFGSTEGQAASADLANFATGRVTVMIGIVPNKFIICDRLKTEQRYMADSKYLVAD